MEHHTVGIALFDGIGGRLTPIVKLEKVNEVDSVGALARILLL